MHDATWELDAGPAGPAEPAAPVQPAVPEQPFEFRGSAREYFRIWIVNLALGIVTLGIYSAWASVRTRRYFHANTWLAGAPFEYSARPLPILRGRLIAALAFALYVLASHTSLWWQLGVAGLIALLMPWLIVRGLAFRARYTSWRGLPFRFEPDYKGTYTWYLAAYLLLVPTLGLAYPWIKARQQRWVATRHHYGNAAFDFESKTSDYYVVLFATLGIAAAAIVAVVLLMAMVFAGIDIGASGNRGGAGLAHHPFVILFTVYALYLPAYLAIFAYSRSRILNLLYNGVRITGGHRLRSTLGCREMYWIYLSNIVAIVCTLGMAAVWAKVRMARYRATHIVLEPAGNLDTFVAETRAQTDIGALGAEMDGFFSIDIGL